MTRVDDAVAPSRPLRKDAARNRELLLAAAREVFAERGLDASLDDIARRAGLGVGTAYRHFANKHELARAIFEQSIDEFIAHAEQAMLHDDPWAGLVGFVESSLEVQAADRGLREALMGAHDPDTLDEVHDRLTPLVADLVDRAKRAGALPAGIDFTDVAILVMVLCQIADLGGDAAPQLWRRYLPIMLAGLQSGAPLPAQPLTETQLRAAMRTHKQRLIGADCGQA